MHLFVYTFMHPYMLASIRACIHTFMHPYMLAFLHSCIHTCFFDSLSDTLFIYLNTCLFASFFLLHSLLTNQLPSLVTCVLTRFLIFFFDSVFTYLLHAYIYASYLLVHIHNFFSLASLVHFLILSLTYFLLSFLT
ncbi:hypothetical protein AtNW77_Chr3g0189951 [Arabidopsis thaliana]